LACIHCRRDGAFCITVRLRLLTCVSEGYDYRLAGGQAAGWQAP
jgi:hypothetical protein